MLAPQRPANFRLAIGGTVCGLLLFLVGCQGIPGSNGGFSWPGSGEKSDPAPPKSTPVAKTGKAAEADITAKIAQGENLERANKLQEARTIYEGLVAAYPDHYQGYHRLGVVADRQRRFTEAEALLAHAIQLHPKDGELFNDMGYCLFLQGKLDKAEAATQKAVAMAPSNARYRNNLGMILGHQGRHEEALAQFRRGGNEAAAQYNLAFVLAAQNKPEEAKRCFSLALAADPSYKPAREALQSFQQFDKDPSVAMRQNVTQDGVRWIPFIEGGQSDASAVQTASATSAASNRLVPSTRPETQAQLRRTRSGSEDAAPAGR